MLRKSIHLLSYQMPQENPVQASEQADFVHVFPKPRNPVGCLFALSSNKPVVKSVSWPAGSAVYAYSEHTAASQSHDSVCPTLLFTPL